MYFDVEVKFTIAVKYVDDITFSQRQNFGNMGGNVDAPIPVKGYVSFPCVSEDALHWRMSLGVVAVILYLTQLCGLVDFRVEHEAIRAMMRYPEYKHRGGIISLYIVPYVIEQFLGQRYGIVGRIGNHVVLKRFPFMYKFAEYHNANLLYYAVAGCLSFNTQLRWLIKSILLT
jgi:hypothetical protein